MDMGINDKYAYAPDGTSILKTNHINNNIHSQILSSVLKITNYNNNNNNNNKNHGIRNNYNIICIVIKLFILVQKTTVRNFIDINHHSEPLSYINNKSVLKIIRDHHTYLLSILPESTTFFSAPLTVY